MNYVLLKICESFEHKRLEEDIRGILHNPLRQVSTACHPTNFSAAIRPFCISSVFSLICIHYEMYLLIMSNIFPLATILQTFLLPYHRMQQQATSSLISFLIMPPNSESSSFHVPLLHPLPKLPLLLFRYFTSFMDDPLFESVEGSGPYSEAQVTINILVDIENQFYI